VAQQQHLIDIPEDEHPWPLILQIATATVEDSWVMVGGMMVHAHALRAGVRPSRPTRDVDMVLDLETFTVGSVIGPLQSLGFTAQPPSMQTHLHRFVRDQDIVDVMVRNGVSARWSRFPLLAAPGATQALARRDRYALQGATASATIAVPDALGAIVCKAAAYDVDRRDRDRHLDDLAVLFASAGPAADLALDRITTRDRRLLRAALTSLSDLGHPSWLILDADDMTRGHRVFGKLSEAIEPDRDRE
jgi:hypothetical protein